MTPTEQLQLLKILNLNRKTQNTSQHLWKVEVIFHLQTTSNLCNLNHACFTLLMKGH